jgi:nitrate reductase NapE component
MMRMKPVRLLSMREMYDIETRRCPIVRPQLTLLPKLPAEPPKRRPNYRHTLTIAACLFVSVAIAGALGWLAWYYLAAYQVYRVVTLAIILIILANAASMIARRKPIDMLATIEHPALRIWNQRRKIVTYTDETYTYLKAIKASLLEH